MPKSATFRCEMFSFSYCASLHISHPTIDPEEITAALGITPNRTARFGDLKMMPNGQPPPSAGTNPRSHWTCDLETHDGDDLEQFLRKLLELLSPHHSFLNRMTSEGGAIDCFLGMGVSRNCDQLLPHELLYKLGELTIDLRLDIYGNELPQKGLES